MADADEDAIPSTSHSSINPNEDPDVDSDEDGPSDYRLLSTLSNPRSAQSTLPKRGTKDFEPNPTRAQSNALDSSREAMHNALSVIRVHPGGKSHNVGIYVGEREKATQPRFTVKFDGEQEGSRCVVVCRWRSTHSKAMGRADRRGWTWLNAEEALYLVERGSLDVRWGHTDEEGGEVEHSEEGEKKEEPGDKSQEEDEDEEPDPEPEELPMSLQGAYATFVGRDGLSLDRYLVYAGLKRAGYIVQRSPAWYDNQDGQTNGHTPRSPTHTSMTENGTQLLSPTRDLISPSSPTLIQRLISFIITPRRQPSCPSLGPLLAPGLYRNYNDIFRALTLVPYYRSSPSSPAETSATPSSSPSCRPKPPFTLAYHVWKPTPNYRKSSPDPPSYYISVIDARSSLVPTTSQIGALLDSMPYSPLENEREKRLEARMKQGRRSVIVAVVDGGVVSYMRFAEGESGGLRLFEEKGARRGGGKGGGRGGARRGGGRGGGGGGGGGRGGKR